MKLTKPTKPWECEWRPSADGAWRVVRCFEKHDEAERWAFLFKTKFPAHVDNIRIGMTLGTIKLRAGKRQKRRKMVSYAQKSDTTIG